jgi:alpha-tubulin suppressor-like RCC1 family protein
LVLLENGTLYSFGLNSSGQLGLGETAVSNALSPTLVKSSATTVLARSVLAAAAGEAFSLALLANGSVASWGLDNDGQLGQGPRTSASFSGQPELVRSPSGSGFLSGIVAIAACANHALALSSDGTVYAWGSNSYGQLAQDPAKLPKSSLPVAVPFSPPQRIRTIACGAQHSLAISTAGELFTFGLDGDGQLGRTGTRHIPLRVQTSTGVNLQEVVRATAGFNFTLALQADGSVLAFGSNRAGAFGDASYPDGLTPRVIITIP